MEYFKVDINNPDNKVINKAAEVIKSGGLIVYPTDTLYGLGVDIRNKRAMDRLFNLKGRSSSKPVSIMVNRLEQIEQLIGNLYKTEYNAAKMFFPGKITLIMQRKKQQNIPGMSHLKKLGFRIPNSKLTDKLINAAGAPVSTTSVNISTKENVKSVEEILEIFSDKIDLIIDAGPIQSLLGSSVLDLTTDPPTLIRKGEISRKEIVQKFGYDISTKYSGKFVITFVCSGNICRSPMAEAILKKYIDGTAYNKIVDINSAGTLSLEPSPAHINAVSVSDEQNINLNGHISRPIQPKFIREANLVIVMALNHFNFLRKHYPAFKNKIVMLKQWKKERALTNPSIADPIGYDKDFFRDTYNEIEREIKRIQSYLLNEIKTYAENNAISV